jgi:hypothetical protein
MMKRLLTLASSTLLFAALSHGAIAIIDSTTLNGSFESDDGSGTSSPDAQFANWTTGGNVDLNQRLDNSPSLGTWSAVVGTESAATAQTLGVIQNTGFIVGSAFGTSESYTLTFDWGDAYNWDDNVDTVNWRLFTTSDNTLSGSVSLIDSGTNSFDTNTANITYQSESFTTGTVVASNIGQELYIEFYSATTTLQSGNLGEFARIDNVTLTAVPEPSSYAMIAAFLALGAVMLRRRA